MKKYNIPIIDIKNFAVENVVTTSTVESWKQTYEEQGANENNISYNALRDIQDIITLTF